MKRNEMIQALLKSENHNVRIICETIVETNFDDDLIAMYLDRSGSFIKSVLRGNYTDALNHADPYNFVCLVKPDIIKFLQEKLDDRDNYKGLDLSIIDITLKVKI